MNVGVGLATICTLAGVHDSTVGHLGLVGALVNDSVDGNFHCINVIWVGPLLLHAILAAIQLASNSGVAIQNDKMPVLEAKEVDGRCCV